jgi:aminoglycoside phosphotransferase (APT) family kinase protein
MGRRHDFGVEWRYRSVARSEIFYPKADCDVTPAKLREFNALSNDALGLTPDTIAAAVADATGMTADRVEPLARQGTFHRVFSLRGNGERELICKIATRLGSDAPTTLRVEASVTDFVRREGIGTPAILAVDASLAKWPFAFLVAERAEGVAMQAFDDDDVVTAQYLDQLVAGLSATHRIRMTGFGLLELSHAPSEARAIPHGGHATWMGYLGTRLEEHVAVCAKIGAVTASDGEVILSWFRRMAPELALVESVLLHGDPGSHNFFVRDGSRGELIDWEDALAGDALYDFAFLATFHPQRRIAALLSACETCAGSIDRRRFWLYFLRVALAKTVHRLRFGYVDVPGREPGHLRIQRGLDELRRAS